ncbi:MAG: flagellar assembly protein FliX [Rickettsiales bacterium]|jgi:hypothetical protein|nr:flagellar assembly protein FliX [Rickettsiales bacterium]|tara:strand:+ start:1672 stop:2097 length:426 start_codon:yes stop_codon:yes gene_type:complete
MKIDRTSSVSSSPIKRSERSQKSGSGKFAKEVTVKGNSGDPVSAAAPVHAVDALLAIQEVDDATTNGGNAQGRQWGGEVLDRLETIRLGILGGAIPISELQAIAELVERQREIVTDPALQSLLDEIELRARVELAKFERDS